MTRQPFTSDDQKSEITLQPCVQIVSVSNHVIKSNMVSSEGGECPVQAVLRFCQLTLKGHEPNHRQLVHWRRPASAAHVGHGGRLLTSPPRGCTSAEENKFLYLFSWPAFLISLLS